MTMMRSFLGFGGALVAFQGCLVLEKLEVDPNYGQGGSSGRAGGAQAGRGGSALGGTPSVGMAGDDSGPEAGLGGVPTEPGSGGKGPVGGSSDGGTPNGSDGGSLSGGTDAGGRGGAEPTPDLPQCGDGLLVSESEDCDDANLDDGDGCSATCTIETGFACSEGDESACAPICGDGLRVDAEADERGCDDGNATAEDGCSAECEVEDGFACNDAEPTVCVASCGDGLVQGAEAQAGGCDDGNTTAGDGCSAACKAEPSYVCSGAPSKCAKTCGDGVVQTGESCDDSNDKAGDGCFACAIEPGFTCSGAAACTDINECASGGSNNCNANATCTNTPGSFTCACKSGYSGNGVTCQNVNECTARTANCHAQATCTDTPGAFTCACKSGYSGNGVTCADVNECGQTPRPCPADEVCANSAGSYTCNCPAGSVRNGTQCVPVFVVVPSPLIGVNADGTVAVGASNDSWTVGYGKWTQSDGMYRTLDSTGEIRDVSGDGRVAVGYTGTNYSNPMRYVLNQPPVSLDTTLGPTDNAGVSAVSHDGSVIVGGAYLAQRPYAWLWTGNQLEFFLDDRGSTEFTSSANGVSSDGNVVVGDRYQSSTNVSSAYKWDRRTGRTEVLATPSGYNGAEANDISNNGQVVVGAAWVEPRGRKPAIWRNGTPGLLQMPASGATVADAYKTNGDGSRASSNYIYWSSTSAPGLLINDYAQTLGADLDGITSLYIHDMSRDGRTLVGRVDTETGEIRGFVLRVP